MLRARIPLGPICELASGYVIDFWGVGYTIAERMGVLPAVKNAGYPVREVRIVDNRGRKVGGFAADVFRRITAFHRRFRCRAFHLFASS